MGTYESFATMQEAQACYNKLLQQDERPIMGYSAEFGRYTVETDPNR